MVFADLQASVDARAVVAVLHALLLQMVLIVELYPAAVYTKQ